MEKLDEHLVDYIQNVIETASLLNVESVVIDEKSVRGQSEDSVFILQKDNLPEDFPFDAIGFGHIPSLKDRMKLFDDFTFSFENKTQKNGYQYPYKVKFKSTKSKTNVDYRCTAPLTIKAPKDSKDPVAFSFYMDEESVKMLVNANRMMRAETVLLSSKNKKVLFQLCDTDSNILEHRITKKIDIIDKDEYGESFAFSYKIKNILPILNYLAKQYDDFEINITNRGFMQLEVNDLKIYILREKD